MKDDLFCKPKRTFTWIYRLILLVMVSMLPIGCANHPPEDGPLGIAFVVPGAAGDGHSYNALRTQLSRAGFGVRTQGWGSPLFAMNFSTQSIHDQAEQSLAKKIDTLSKDVRVIVVGHSAGGGVALGAVARLQHRSVETVIVLAPSVSPGYDLAPALARVSGTVHSFYSPHDVTFLKWRTGNFGTYDRIRTPAAGYLGFSTRNPKLIQHAFEESWRELGNKGGHWGALTPKFIQREVIGLILNQ